MAPNFLISVTITLLVVELNTLDFYLWDHLKSLVYSSPVDDVYTLQPNYSRMRGNYETRQEFGSVLASPWDVDVRPALGQGVHILNSCSGALKNTVYVLDVKN